MIPSNKKEFVKFIHGLNGEEFKDFLKLLAAPVSEPKPETESEPESETQSSPNCGNYTVCGKI